MSEFYNEKDYELKEDSFKFVQLDKKIHDVKFETKPTTFAKDAFKRFVRNKSSVVAAFIIGFLFLFSIIIPVVSPFDISSNHNEQSLLPPKLFNAGTGFWDGTKKYENILWDASKEAPADFNPEAVIKIVEKKDGEYTNTPTPYAEGGYMHLVSDFKLAAGENKYENPGLLMNYTTFNVNATDNYKVSIVLGDVDNINNNKLAEYRILLKNNTSQIVLKDWSKDYGTLDLNISDSLHEANKTEMNNAQLVFQIARDSNYFTYLLVESVQFSCDLEDEEVTTLLSEISFDDANKAVQLNRDDLGKFPVGYWRSNFIKGIYQAALCYVTFIYDEYAAKLQYRTISVGGSEIQKYIDNGWIEYDFNEGPSSFKVLNEEKSPIRAVISQSYSEQHKIYNLSVEACVYKYLGLDSMPRYLFGTTIDGKDLITLAFNSLRTSLLIAIIVSAVCFIFGLCWGSISGYFGGNVDLAMERFCEILSGVPYIVVMTLALLLLGNNIGVFALGLCLTGWIGVAARTRTQFYRFKGREYVLASRTLGASDTRLIFKHILPNALGTIITSSVLMVPSVIFSEATLSYLGLGLQGVQSFGVLLSQNQQYLSTFPALIIFPAVIISLLMISFNLFGNGLRDALNPSLKGSE